MPPTGASFSGSSAEWIMEQTHGSALPSFSPLQFSPAVACNNSFVAAPMNHQTLNIVDDSGVAAGKPLTSVSLGNYSVTINFIG